MTLIDKAILFVKEELQNAEGGHDWFHIERVYKNALLIAQEEKCNIEIVKLGALLHDIADSKFHNGNENIGPQVARSFLEKENVAEIVKTISLTIKSKDIKLEEYLQNNIGTDDSGRRERILRTIGFFGREKRVLSSC